MKHKNTVRLLVLLLACLLTAIMVSCGAAGNASYSDYEKYPEAENSADEELGYTDKLHSSTENITESRKIIKTVHETVETETYDAFIEGLKNAVTAAGGYISSSHYTGSENEIGDRSASFVIRIPAEQLAAFTGSVDAISTVLSYEESQEDITLAYVDIESRIEVLEAERVALLDILSSAKDTSEMLEIRAHLEDIQAELASLKAKKRVYDDKVAYSTVNLAVYEVEKESEPEQDGFLAKLADAFLDSIKGVVKLLGGLAILFVASAPYLILFGVIGLVIFLIIRGACRRRAKKRKNGSTE